MTANSCGSMSGIPFTTSCRCSSMWTIGLGESSCRMTSEPPFVIAVDGPSITLRAAGLTLHQDTASLARCRERTSGTVSCGDKKV
jgi:hypothetical protein